VPSFNVLNGGAHADNELDFQEFMIMPAGLPNFREAFRAGAEVYHALAHLLESKQLSVSVGDEGGFAPRIRRPEEALDLLMEATERAGYRPGEEVFFSLDPAANGFFHPTLYGGGGYRFDDREMEPEAMVDLYEGWLRRYPILSIEDGLAEEDSAGWRLLSQRLRERVQLVGDDIFVSNPARVRAAMAEGIGNAVLLKPNQIGTVSEILETARVAREGGFRQMVSHRSGETTDDFIADLAVAIACGQIKAGAPARGERVAKYNRLLWIERQLGTRAVFAGRETFAASGA
jgi:enolase